MLGYFSSCQYASSLAALILRRADDISDDRNPSALMKILALEDVLETEYHDVKRELSVSFREHGTILTIHLPLTVRELTPELCTVLRLEEDTALAV